MTTALIIVDVQPDFCEGGRLAVVGGNRVAELIARDYKLWSPAYDLMITTQDWHIDPGSHFSDKPDFVDSWPPHCRATTPGAQLHPDIANLTFDYHILKGQHHAAYSGFEGYDRDNHVLTLQRILNEAKVDYVDIMGIAFDYCVARTALDSARLGLDTAVHIDYTASVNPDNDAETASMLEAHGIQVLP